MPAQKQIRVRFAPSPTGELHIGNARTALFNWLFARKEEGVFVLRIEDTDVERSDRCYEDVVLNGLKWLGLDWDEGPDIGGPHSPYRQSERLSLYDHYLGILMDKGFVYPCYCNDEELKAEREIMLAQGLPPRYRGRCRHLTNKERRRLEAEGRRPAMRFKVAEELVEVDDLIHGSVVFDTTLFGDFIIVRSSGIPAYNFAVVIDDALMQVSHVIRGEDHLSNTPRQILLYQALGFDIPKFAHHALLLGPDRTKLSKRHGVTSVEAFRQKGYVPEALVNYMAWLGGGFRGEKEILDKEEIIDQFDLKHAGKNAPVFDEKKLHWMNTRHLRRLPPEKLLEYWFDLTEGEGRGEEELLLKIVPEVIGNLETLDQLRGLVEIFSKNEITFSEEAQDVLQAEPARKVLSAFRDVVESVDNYCPGDQYREFIKRVQTLSGCKGRTLFMTMRAALTGKTQGPELEKIITHLDKKTILLRIEQALRTYNHDPLHL